MPATPAPSRHRRDLTAATPTARPSRPQSPTSTTNFTNSTISTAHLHKINIVSRVALDGKAKQGKDGASVKMYFKLSVPYDVAPGATIPLCLEENLKILECQVHPLDHNSAPYSFSGTAYPLLHSAARALALPPRSTTTYHTAYGLSPPQASSRSNGASSSRVSHLAEEKYTGQIVVSSYHICYIVPTIFPPRSENSEDTFVRTKSRRASLGGDKNNMQFMAAISAWVPYATKPPRYPFLLSIPIPRCLHNSAKIRIFPPESTSSSFASLSSDDESLPWDLASDPRVTRPSSRSLHKHDSTNQFADDESSDSEANITAADGIFLRGSFPSTERLRVRWAKPSKTVVFGDVGRRRVGVQTAQGDMTCTVTGRARGGITMDVEYKGVCRDLWFPGVATMLGLDVGLIAQGCDVMWTDKPEWNVSGPVGFDLSAVGPRANGARFDSMDPLSPPSPTHTQFPSSSPSLLRAPLPEGGELSLDASSSSLSADMPSVSSLPSDRTDPSMPLTLYVNMNDLLPPAKNQFDFKISGSIIVAPRVQPNDTFDETTPVVLPRFTVHAADGEKTSITVRNEADALVEVFNLSGDIHRDAQARKTVLQRGAYTRCGQEGGRIALKRVATVSRPLTPGRGALVHNPGPAKSPIYPRPVFEGPRMLSCVTATVTPLLRAGERAPDAYSVRLCFPAPVFDAQSRPLEWVEFGLANPEARMLGANVAVDASHSSEKNEVDLSSHLHVDITSASADNIPVKYEVGGGGGRQWISWIRVHVEGMPGAMIVVDYCVRTEVSNVNTFDVLLPTFGIPVGKMVVDIETQGLRLSMLESNLAYEQVYVAGRRLLHHSLSEFFYPKVSIALHPASPPRTGFQSLPNMLIVLTCVIAMALCFMVMWRLSDTSHGFHNGMLDDAAFAALLDMRLEALRTAEMNAPTNTQQWLDEPSIDTLDTRSWPSSEPTQVLADEPTNDYFYSEHVWHDSEDTIHDDDDDTQPSLSKALSFPSAMHIPFDASRFRAAWANAKHRVETLPWDDVRKVAGRVWDVCLRIYHYPLDPP
ncbi:hypothetical protein FISHEDRAFT_78984 [Fistulina hepatica ATCC 64428]|uniref:Uncharacterized protein n=1 Tax=Fistulina hepatica ATCC 64428 TaxID=1128425 RepID=A0A0D6ZYQ0_9AGAR|nr:hypothetical protein FISHEDRAFT_78984 [Fistulina hepatica ATCC 64428]